jgi:hypothetical protein
MVISGLESTSIAYSRATVERTGVGRPATVYGLASANLVRVTPLSQGKDHLSDLRVLENVLDRRS